MGTLVTGLLWVSAVGCGLSGGLYFAFSTFIMTALGRTGAPAGVITMNAINVAILRSLFMPLFFGTSMTGLALAVIGALHWGQPGATAMLTGGAVDVLGMTLVTMPFNVPLNNALAASDPATAQGAALWSRYLARWTLWNHVRTVASTISAACFIAALVGR